jgi:hypothetical protein
MQARDSAAAQSSYMVASEHAHGHAHSLVRYCLSQYLPALQFNTDCNPFGSDTARLCACQCTYALSSFTRDMPQDSSHHIFI